jgi:hypothetical protein
VSVATAADAPVPVLTQEIVDVPRCDLYSSSCCTEHGGVGCDDSTCETIVCNGNSACCNIGWSESCKVRALEQCSVCMDSSLPDCCTEHPATTGCNDAVCEAILCGQERFCCDTE